jgi:hypothetical protein
MKKIFFILIIFSVSLCHAQNRNTVWIFGDSAGIDFSSLNNPVPIFSGMDARSSCANISDSIGNLLFYCFTTIQATDSATFIYNSTNNLMANGSPLVGLGLYNGLVIVPFVYNQNLYFVFHVGAYSVNGLYYSVVDMSLNGGLGAVIQKNIQINNLWLGDCISAVKHGNGRDWWLITKLGGNGATQIDRFYSYLITANGQIVAPIIQDFGIAWDAVQQKTIFNSATNKVMNINTGGYMAEYDFDRCTGLFSNPNIIFPQQTSNFSRVFVGGAYSNNDSVFYASKNSFGGAIGSKNYLYQYDLTASNIANSQVALDSISYPPADNFVLRMAPNGKIYYTQAYISATAVSHPYPDSMRNYINENLGVINNPNVVGTGCNFQPFSFYLGGKRTYYALPNNPDYELGPLAGSVCDTLHVGVNSIDVNNHAQLFVYYQSNWKSLFVNASGIKGKNCLLKIVDINGRMVYSSTHTTQPPYFTQDVDCSALAKGMYVVQLITEKEVMSKKFIKH